MTTYIDDTTIRQWLEKRAKEDSEKVYCIFEDEPVNYAVLEEKVNRIANAFLDMGLKAGDRIALMVPNHPELIYTIFACIKLGVVFTPFNTQLKGANLDLLIELTDPRAVLVDEVFADVMVESLVRGGTHNIDFIIGRGTADLSETKIKNQLKFADLLAFPNAAPPAVPGPQPDDTLTILFTSGTTGLPKGVPLTDRMWRACAKSTQIGSDAQDGDTMFLWEAFSHVGGMQVLFVCLIYGSKIAMVSKFSASKFWEQIRHYNATQFHFLGGVIQILLKQPPRDDDKDHPVRIAWGGGVTAEAWAEFSERFGVPLHEMYGMSESSSITTINNFNKIGSIGKPVDHFEVRIVDDAGNVVPTGSLGEIQVRGKQPGLVLKEYFRNPEATAKSLLADGWFSTGDLGSVDEEGFYYFRGRAKDCLRRRGENISAWEVERIINEHPDIEECALIGVPGEIDEELKIFIKCVDGVKNPDPKAIADWCEPLMAKYQIPRFYAFIDEFPKTASQRIKKTELPRTTDDCWDREAAK